MAVRDAATLVNGRRLAGEDGTMLHAGAGVTTITPPLGSAVSGSFEERWAETVDDELTARALVLDDGAAPVALVVCDLICLAAETVAAARARIAERCGIPAELVMISCTHTHTGPATTALLSVEPDTAYLDWLPGRIADAVAIARSRMVPARVAWGAADIDGVCFNRRFRMADGTVVFNPALDDPAVGAPVGPVDPGVTALLVEDGDGAPLALWANLALHYVGHDNPLAISADYYGDYARAVARALGERCVGLLTNGASGDVNNRDLARALPLPAGTARARLVGTAVAAAAIQATAMARRHQAPALAAETIPYTVERRPITDADVALAEAIVARAAADPAPASFDFVVGQPIPGWQVPTYAREVIEVARMPRSVATELQVMRVGDLALAAIPGELFVALGLALKAASPLPLATVVSLANDYVGYLPTEAPFGEGGYETWAARSAWPAPGTGEAMITAALAGLRRLGAGPAPSASA